MTLFPLVILALLAAACSAPTAPQSAATAVPEPTAAQTTAPAATSAPAAPPSAQAPAATEASAADGTATTFHEAPALTKRVADGQLPPLAERLPAAPLVVPVVEQIGTYGGTWRAGLVGSGDTLWLQRTIGYENLVRWNPEWTEVIPNVAEAFEASADATNYTFTLREGLRWSDGAPFTADDILFWYEDISLNPELTPNRGPNPPTVEKIDEYTVRFSFEEPNGLFLQTLATTTGEFATRFPKHYLQQFHPTYNADGLEALVTESGAANWVELFQRKGAAISGTPYDAIWSNPELPRLHAWTITVPYGESTQVVAERNPYYFKVDPDGNQLPYIDRVVYEVVQSADVLLLKALNGEIDMQDRHIATLPNKAVFADNMEQGGYRFFDSIPATMNTCLINLNLSHKDPTKRELFQNKDFRIGLSHAIHRQEIIDLVFVGQGEPFQAAPRPESPFYDEELATQYTEYNVELANEHLDKAGLSERDSEGFRLGPDGKRISFVVEIATGFSQAHVDVMQLVATQWKEVGIEAAVKPIDRALFDTRRLANEHDVVIWDGAGGLDVIQNGNYYFPRSNRSDFAQAWATWYLNPSGDGAQTVPEEPPAAVQQQMELNDQLTRTSDTAEQDRLMREILAIAADQFYTIGISLPANTYGIVKNNFRNVPAVMPSAFVYPSPAPTNPSQYFIEP
jgi:peptide/nickel transport system substrate-binding protein